MSIENPAQMIGLACYVKSFKCAFAQKKYKLLKSKQNADVCLANEHIKASAMLVAARISGCFGLPWSAIVCLGLL